MSCFDIGALFYYSTTSTPLPDSRLKIADTLIAENLKTQGAVFQVGQKKYEVDAKAIAEYLKN